MQITAPAATRPFTTAASAVRRISAPIAHRRGRRPLNFPLAPNLAALAIIALSIALALIIRL